MIESYPLRRVARVAGVIVGVSAIAVGATSCDDPELAAKGMATGSDGLADMRVGQCYVDQRGKLPGGSTYIFTRGKAITPHVLASGSNWIDVSGNLALVDRTTKSNDTDPIKVTSC